VTTSPPPTTWIRIVKEMENGIIITVATAPAEIRMVSSIATPTGPTSPLVTRSMNVRCTIITGMTTAEMAMSMGHLSAAPPFIPLRAKDFRECDAFPRTVPGKQMCVDAVETHAPIFLTAHRVWTWRQTRRTMSFNLPWGLRTHRHRRNCRPIVRPTQSLAT
jgi:hypothetical protein